MSDALLLTAIETVSAAQFILPPMAIYKVAGHYRGWYTELGEAEGDGDAKFAYSPKGYTTNEPGMAWFQHFDTWTSEYPADYYPPPPLNPISFLTHHTTAETSASRPSTLLLLSAQIQHLLPIVPLHSYVALPTRVKLPWAERH